ncbi:SRPBCC family protein [Streptosporangium subroseum]|uniref:SRPBCC family protein n=1 Tax=Streptosporangium subroseum TaxID=106412 RepID=UPI00308B24A9|nr:SRPBCC family protein [Streptosporangium subroseum]
MRFTNTVRIERPAGVVFAYLADLRNLPAWNYAIRETQPITPGPAGLGSVYRQLRSLPRPMHEQLEIIEYEPDHRLVIEGGFGHLQGRAIYNLDGSAAATDLVNEFELHAGTLNALSGLATRGIARAVAQNLQVLKNILETPNTRNETAW